jgi:hypothetical protein
MVMAPRFPHREQKNRRRINWTASLSPHRMTQGAQGMARECPQR